MNRLTLILVAGCLLGPLAPHALLAQTAGEDPAPAAKLQLGPLALAPKLAIRNIGVDTNIFNASGTPQRDFTTTVAPGTDAWLRVGRLRLSSKTEVEWNYFQKATTQRSLNFNVEGRADLDLTHLAPYVTAKRLRTRQRPNLEIDLRVLQKRQGGSLGTAVFLGPRLRFNLEGSYEQFDLGDTQFGSVELADALNRESTEIAVAGRFDVTALTTVVVRAASRKDRFEFSPLRNSESVSIIPGLEFKPFALVSGSAFVGFRRFTTLSPMVADFSGVVSSVDLKYVAREATRVIGRVSRDVDYSFDPTQPFFLTTTVSFDVTQAMGIDWDVVGRLSRTTLNYEGILANPGGMELPGRTDHIRSFGVGLGRRVGTGIRIGFDVDYVTRDSNGANRADRVFDGFKFGGSITYGY